MNETMNRIPNVCIVSVIGTFAELPIVKSNAYNLI